MSSRRLGLLILLRHHLSPPITIRVLCGRASRPQPGVGEPGTSHRCASPRRVEVGLPAIETCDAGFDCETSGV
jgi:hypothetical protein